MVNIGNLVSRPLNPIQNFNRIFLLELIVCGILTLFFLFYLNRLFATIISYGIRAYTWHKFRIYVDFQAVQVSFLGGRLFFKGVRYHGENETILIQHGFITWKYWLRAVKQADCVRFEHCTPGCSTASEGDNGTLPTSPPAEADLREAGPAKASKDLPCRISVSVSGFEWFIYNRSPVYDTIATSQIFRPDEHLGHGKGSTPQASPSFHSANAGDGPLIGEPRSDLPAAVPPLILAFFPLLVECQKGAIVIGNENTRVISTTCFDRCKGLIDATKSSPRDIYRQIFELEVTHPVVQMKPNPDYRQSQQSAAQQVLRDPNLSYKEKSWWKVNGRLRHRRRQAIRGLRNLVPYFRESVVSFQPSPFNESMHAGRGTWPSEVPGESRWLGLSRYLDENDRDDHEGWSSIEYARFSNIIECPSVHIHLYWDVPGLVRAEGSQNSKASAGAEINLAKAPEYGLDLIVRGGNINYGPWADRARAEIQSLFFPNSYQDAVLTDPLPLGSTRQSTMLSVNIHLENEISFRLPTRENSKDRQWKGRAVALSNLRHHQPKKHARKRTGENLLGPDVRPFGWFAVAVGANSTVSFNMDLVARKDGYRNELDLDLNGTRMTTSVNHSLLWKCERQKISCNLSNPLKWNSSHRWTFECHNYDMELFPLRDHAFLLTDLITDFTSGPQSDFLTFVPFLYQIKLSFDRVKLYLNVNDSNIIDSPCDTDENNFLTLYGEHLSITIDIPVENFAHLQNKVDFQAWARDARLDVTTPVWNTAHSFASDMPTATLKDFSMEGSYDYYTSTSSELTDTLLLKLSGTSARVYLYGSLIRQCIKLKDNYGGDDIHFHTLGEYQELLFKPEDTTTNTSQPPSKNSNDLDIILNVVFDRVCVLLPANIHSRKENLRLDFLCVETDVRFSNYYMDLGAEFSPVEAAWENVEGEEAGFHNFISTTQAFVDGISIYGHRLFGAPPAEPTYLCNWDLDVGKVSGESSANFARVFLQALRCFAFTFSDDENALPPSHVSPIHDITFLRINVDEIKLWFVLDETAILFEAGKIEIAFNDWAGRKFSERIKIEVPNIKLAVVDHNSALRHHGNATHRVRTHALLQLSLVLRMVEQKKDFVHQRALQQQYVSFHDQRTRRVAWLLHSPSQVIEPQTRWDRSRLLPPAMPIPYMPAPLSSEEHFTLSRLKSETRLQRALDSKLSDKSSTSSKYSIARGPTLQPTNEPSTPTVPHNHSHPHHCASRSSFKAETSPQAQSAKVSGARNWTSKSRVHRKASTMPRSSRVSPNPWMSPPFQLSNVVPDSNDLPAKPRNAHHTTTNYQHFHGVGGAIEDPEDSSKTIHTRVDVDMGSTVRAFASPLCFSAIATLLQALQPVQPVDLLDDLHISTMSRILKIANVGPELLQRTDICVRVPFTHFRMVNPTLKFQKPSNIAINDQYDLQLIGTRATVRSNVREKRTDQHTSVRNGLRLHVIVHKSHLEVHDRSTGIPRDKAAARVAMENIMFWTVSDEHTSIKYQQRALEVNFWGSQIDFLASLVQRTTEMLKFISTQFQRPQKLDRIERLAYHLTDAAAGNTDPQCLTRPSYVLRVADQHVRLHDSWKILSRFRHMLQSLNPEEKTQLTNKISPDSSLPLEAAAKVLSNFDKWRSWDLAHVKKALVMEEIWQRAGSMNSLKPRRSEISAEFTLETARLLLDPGSRESRIDVQSISAAARMTTGGSDDGEEIGDEHIPSSVLVITSYCSRFNISFNWDLMRFICEESELFRSNYNPSKLSTPSSIESSQPLPSFKRLQIVIGTDSGVIAISAINVKLAVVFSGLKGTVLHQIESSKLSSSSLVFGTNSLSVKLRNDEKVLLRLLLENLTFQLSRITPASRYVDPTELKAIVKCEALCFETREEIPEVLRIADCVVRDEINIIKALVLHPDTDGQVSQGQRDTRLRIGPNVYIAFILEQYSLSLAVLTQLVYVFSGGVIRASIVPRSRSHMTIDFDMDKHSQALRIRSEEKVHQMVEFNLPPINCRMLLHHGTSPTKLNLEATMDKIELDARSIRACVEMINKPEAFRTFLNTREVAQQVAARWRATVQPSKRGTTSPSSAPSSSLRYTASLAFIGLRVHASAPALKSKDYRADLEFIVGLTTVRISDQGPDRGSDHGNPQFDVAIRLISLQVYRRSSARLIQGGNLDLSGRVTKKIAIDDENSQISMYHASSHRFDVNFHPETAYLVVDIAAHLQERIKSFTFPNEARRLKPLRRLTIAGLTEAPIITVTEDDCDEGREAKSTNLFNSVLSIELNAIKIAWRLDEAASSSRQVEDLILSVRNIKLDTKREGSATLAIAELQLQMAPKSLASNVRSSNSALMPEMIFKVAYVSTKCDRRLAFQAAGKELGLRLASDFIVPASALHKALTAAHAELRAGSALWAAQPVSSKKDSSNLFSNKRLASLLIDVDFAGAGVSVRESSSESERQHASELLKREQRSRTGRHDYTVRDENAAQAVLRAPGVAMKIEYSENGESDPALNAEVKIAASSNVLHPSVVPLVIQMSSSVKEIVGYADEDANKSELREKTETEKPTANSSLVSSDPVNLMGRCKLNLGLWIREQEFSLSCQPIARVAATTRFNHIFMAVNTVASSEQGRFFAISANISGFQASVQHVYSRESTASIEVDTIVLSTMNSKHVSNTTGLSVILNVSPLEASVNAKQLQDFLLFREIWYPAELRRTSTPTTISTAPDSQGFVVQRYQQVAAAGAFPWNVVISIQEVRLKLDLGQGLGKSTFTICKIWTSSKKASDFEQNLCLGFDQAGVECTGRMSGFMEVRKFRIRTSIRWPQVPLANKKTPHVQASLGVDQFRGKAVFDYQPFAIAEISKFNFLMYNVSSGKNGEKDRLVGNLEGERVHVFFTTSTAAQVYGLYQAMIRLNQENAAAYQTSLKELNRHLQRKPVSAISTMTSNPAEQNNEKKQDSQGPFSLQTDVVVALQAVDVGIFPSTFFDNQIFKVEVKDAQARFAVSVINAKIQSSLGLTLGQLRVALSSVNRGNTPVLGEVSVGDVVDRATTSRGGTILRVPKAIATMQTWQSESSNKIDYIFKSTFEGKVDVGWNYSRISFIRGMWATHSRTLASWLGKPLPQSAVQITGGPEPDDVGKGSSSEKITAVVNVPQSRFEYKAVEPPVMETPQLRDMGEATPPLEWIGLHRDKLPHVTHQIVIVTLLEVAKKVEDAYSKILGSSS